MTSHGIHTVSNTVMNFCYNAGQPCCAQYTKDARWYRAAVLAVASQNTNQKLLKIEYVDYGNVEYQPVDK
jgi:Tudor domain.